MFLTKTWRGTIRLASRRDARGQHRQPHFTRRLCLEPLEDRSLLSSYAITDIGAVQLDHSAYSGTQLRINNAATPQVIGASLGGLEGQHAFLWDSIHGRIDLGTMGQDNFSAAYGINDAGTVTGISEKWTLKLDKKTGNQFYVLSSENGFLWTAANGMKGIGQSVYPAGINNSGELISTRNSQAAVFVGNKWTQLGTLPAGTYSRAIAINDYGQVVGYGDFDVNPSNQLFHAFLWTPSAPNGATGTMIDLGAIGPGLGASAARAANGSGWVTGFTANINVANGANHAFVWQPTTANGTSGTMLDLGTLAINSSPGLSQSEGNAINRYGVIVGDSNPAGARSQDDLHAVIWQPAPGGGYTLTDLNNLIPAGSGWTLTRADGINDNGQIVVETAQGHALLLTPGSALMADKPGAVPVMQNINPAQIQPLLAEAIHRWQAAGVDTSGLGNIQVRVTNLGELTLGMAAGHTIALDDNAAGWGWFVDQTPSDDSEFLTPGNQGEQNRMDLLTVLEHEVGHLLGYEHQSTGVMIDTLPAGTRRVPGNGIDASPQLDGRDLFISFLDADQESPSIGGSGFAWWQHRK